MKNPFDMYDGIKPDKEKGLRKYEGTKMSDANALKGAEELYNTIKANVPIKDGLYGYAGLNDYISVSENAPVAILAKLLGKDDEAREIYLNIKRQIGKHGNGLYNESIMPDMPMGGAGPCTKGNALMGMLSLMHGDVEEAENLYECVNKEIGKSDNNLYGMDCFRKGSWSDNTHDNALMGVFIKMLGRNPEANNIFDEIDSMMRMPSGLYGHTMRSEIIYTEDNASMAIFCDALGNYLYSEEIFSNIESVAGKDKGLYLSMEKGAYMIPTIDGKRSFSAQPSALIGIYLCLKGGKKLQP